MVQFDGAIIISLYRMPEFEASWGRIFLWIYRKRSIQGATLVMELFRCTKFLVNRLSQEVKNWFLFWYKSYKSSSDIGIEKLIHFLKNLIFWQSLILNFILQRVL